MDPNSLPQTTTERLLAVADIIDLNPERWDQSCWIDTGDMAIPGGVYGRGMECGTTACIAGWAVILTPRPTDAPMGYDWYWAGAQALGLDVDFAEYLFRATLPLDHTEVADVLRRLAKLDEGERTGDRIAEVLTPEQHTAISNWDHGHDDD